jgi:hypothetical protein
MGNSPLALDGERKHMKKLAFVMTGAGALLTVACNKGNEDQVNNAELNQPATELNALANEAANTADEANALSNQAQNLANEANTAGDNTVNPKDADEQNVSGM